jgi:hypothetical protein
MLRLILRRESWVSPLRVIVLVALACLGACSWFGSKKPRSPDPTELIVTGAPAGSLVFVDGLQNGSATAPNNRPQALSVAPGVHKVEIHMGDAVVYREDTYVSSGEHRLVVVLSGSGR